MLAVAAQTNVFFSGLAFPDSRSLIDAGSQYRDVVFVPGNADDAS